MGANDAVSTPDGKAGAAGKTTPPGKEIVRETKKRGEAWQMLIVKDGAAKEGGEARHSILQIPHPRHGEKTVFFLVGHQVLEVRRSKGQEYSCWFVGDTVQADPGIAVATPIDPLFLAVSALETSRNRTADHAGRFCSQEQVFSAWTDSCSEALQLASLPAMDLKVICDVQMVGDEGYFRLNDDKVLRWVKAKVEAVLEHMYPGAGKDGWSIPVLEAPAANASVEDKIKALAAGDLIKAVRDKLLMATGLVCEYLDASWREKVLEAYSLAPKDLEPSKVAAAMAPGDEQFRSIVSGAGKREREDAATAAAAKKAKVVSNAERISKKEGVKGMMSMASFFKPKPKA